MGANVKVNQFGIGLREEDMGHQMKNIGRSKKSTLYDSVLGSDGCTFLLLSLTAQLSGCCQVILTAKTKRRVGDARSLKFSVSFTN
jgi:hypothetical protein